MNQLFNRAALLAAAAPVTQDVEVEGLGTVRIKQLSVAEMDDARARGKANSDSSFGLAMVAYAVVDEAGAPLLDVADLQPLQAAAGTKVDALVKAVLAVNGYKGADAKN